MNFIQSYWSGNQTNIIKSNSGWLSPEYNLMSWAFSCLKLKEHHSNITLYADSVVAKVLIDVLKLPYENVVCNLDELNNYNSGLWALPKIFTYSQQEQPFLHIDGDVFIWKAFSSELLQGELIAQNIEAATSYYESIMQNLENGLIYFPDEIKEERRNKNLIYAYNAGILGGTDIAFFKEYSIKAFEFVDRNISQLSRINVTNFNIFFEQYLFYCISKKKGKRVSVLIDEIIGDNRYRGFGDFTEVPYNKQFLHLLGVYKRNQFVCDQMAQRLRLEYPEMYYRIIETVQQNKAPLFKNYYYYPLLYTTKEETLLKRYKALKENSIQSEQIKVFKNQDRIKIENKNVFSRKEALKSLLSLVISKQKPDYYCEDLINQDLVVFENALSEAIKVNFKEIDVDSLYARDIFISEYYDYMFANADLIHEKSVVLTAPLVTIKSKFDFSELLLPEKSNKLEVFLQPPEVITTAIVPECDQTGYSLVNIDELDIQILNLANKPVAIDRIFAEIKDLFDGEEVIELKAEFEKLILGRIKIAIQNKLIKPVMAV